MFPTAEYLKAYFYQSLMTRQPTSENIRSLEALSFLHFLFNRYENSPQFIARNHANLHLKMLRVKAQRFLSLVEAAMDSEVEYNPLLDNFA